MARLWRIHHPLLPAAPGRELTVEGGEAHHVIRVLRLQEGERVGVFDGAGTEWRAVIVSAERGRVVLRTEVALDDEIDSPFDLALFQGLCRPERLEWLIQKATEIGVASVTVFRSRRCDARPPAPRRIERWRRIGIEACKQSGRRRAPRVDVLEELPDPPADGTLGIVLDPAGGTPPLSSIATGPAPAGLWLAVGPESGFEPDEVRTWEARGWRRAGLGPRVLRSDTAGLVAASILLHRWADLGSGPAA